MDIMAESIVLPELTGVIEQSPRTRRKNPKRAGELSEAAFLWKAESLGFRVVKPWGDSERYDFILDSGGRLWRVQGKAGYTAEDIDVLVVHIPPCNVWYVLPVDVIALSKNLRFYPDIECKCARWERYREAWSLMGGE